MSQIYSLRTLYRSSWGASCDFKHGSKPAVKAWRWS